VVGKAEHLKALLLEWMQRMDGPQKLYSSNEWDLHRGKGAIREIEFRRTWREADLWVSDRVLSFGPPVLVGGSDEGGGGGGGQRGGVYLRNEYLYVGRTTPGELTVSDIAVVGPSAPMFTVEATANATLKQNQHVRIKVSLSSPEPVDSSRLKAALRIANSASGVHRVEIRGGETGASFSH
jgi:hypothetical protein